MGIEDSPQAERNFMPGDSVKVLRTSGEIDEGWKVDFVVPGADAEATRVMVSKGGFIKQPTLKDLREWNK